MIQLLYGLTVAIIVTGQPGLRSLCAADDYVAGETSAIDRVNPDELLLEAKRFFDQLVERYRNLTSYSDVSRIIQIVQHAGEPESQRVETEISCEVDDGALRVQSSASQLRRLFGIELPVAKPGPVEQAELRYQLWMLPHLTLKFADQPLEQFRDGVEDGFTATDMSKVIVDDRPMVQLELRSGRREDGEAEATFDLLVDPDSMLIERIHGHQRLPDGGNFETTVEITPRQVDNGRRSSSSEDRASHDDRAIPQEWADTPSERGASQSDGIRGDDRAGESADAGAEPDERGQEGPRPAPVSEPQPSPEPEATEPPTPMPDPAPMPIPAPDNGASPKPESSPPAEPQP
jgi:hypothetical protein